MPIYQSTSLLISTAINSVALRLVVLTAFGVADDDEDQPGKGVMWY